MAKFFAMRRFPIFAFIFIANSNFRMGRPQSSAVWKHFSKDGTKRATCQVKDCSASSVGSQATANLKAHLKAHHKNIYDAVQKEDAETKVKPDAELPADQPTLNFAPVSKRLTKSE
jgi:hypothetical protein